MYTFSQTSISFSVSLSPPPRQDHTVFFLGATADSKTFSVLGGGGSMDSQSSSSGPALQQVRDHSVAERPCQRRRSISVSLLTSLSSTIRSFELSSPRQLSTYETSERRPPATFSSHIAITDSKFVSRPNDVAHLFRRTEHLAGMCSLSSALRYRTRCNLEREKYKRYWT